MTGALVYNGNCLQRKDLQGNAIRKSYYRSKKEGEKYVLTLPCADLHVAIINCLTAFSRRDTSDPATLAILVIFLPYQIAINVIYAE